MLKATGVLPYAGGKPKKLVVLFHGYGSYGGDLLDLARCWSPLMPEVEFLTPDGFAACETYPGGYQWFGLTEFTPLYVHAGLAQARPALRDYLLDALAQRNLTLADLAVVGFSQGGMVALDMVFALPGLRGAICYSGGFYPPEGISPTNPGPNGLPEVLLVHGDADPVVPYALFQESQRQLEKLGMLPQTLTCSGLGHSIDREGIETGGQFLVTLFGKVAMPMQKQQQGA